MLTWIVGACVAGLVVAYMVAVRHEQVHLTSARFFDLPPDNSRQLRWGLPRPTRPFWLQLAALLLIFLAFVLTNCKRELPREGLGIWVMLDTSASMSVTDPRNTRLDKAREQLDYLMARAAAQTAVAAPWFRLTAFDMELQPAIESTESQVEVRSLARNLQPRPLGTDLDLVRREWEKLHRQKDGDRIVSHLVVLTDQPPPAWATAATGTVAVVWIDVAEIADNHGFIGLEAVRHPFSGRIEEVRAVAMAYGQPPRDTTFLVTNPRGETVTNLTVNWPRERPWHGSFAPTAPGFYKLSLTGADTYSWDNTAVIHIGPEQEVGVDWLLPDRSWPDLIGWKATRASAQLRVGPWPGTTETNLPVLLAGNGFRPRTGSERALKVFREKNPIVADLNLDAVEQLGWQGLAADQLPPGLSPLLSYEDNTVLVAWSAQPPRVFLPGIPAPGNDFGDRVGQTLFFNSIRWLFGKQPAPPLYELTSPAHPNVDDRHLALHSGEGETSHAGVKSGEFRFDAAKQTSEATVRLWQFFLLGALFLATVDRCLVVWGGKVWR